MVFHPSITHSEKLYLILSKDDNTRYLPPQARNRQYHNCTFYWKRKKSFFKMPRWDKSDTSSVAACTLILQQQLRTKDIKFVGTTNHEQCSDEISKYILSWSKKHERGGNHKMWRQWKGFGSTQLQKGEAVAFASRTFSQVEQQYAWIEKRCPAIVFTSSKFSQYITMREGHCWEWSQADTTNLCEVFATSLMSPSKKCITISEVRP